MKVDTILSALADSKRRGVVDLLRKRPRRAGELASALKLSPPAMSRHLQHLRRSGLVEEQRLDQDARVRVYRLRRQPFAALGAWLDQVQAFWDDQLGSFKAHTERRGRS